MQVPLNLPQIDYKIQEIESKTYIFDEFRRKYILLTPEEWVRQHFAHLLVNHYQYPKKLISLERGMKYNALAKRTDIVVYDLEKNPLLLVECKATDIAINQAVMEQASRYNKTLKAPYLVVSNGLKTFCFDMSGEKIQQMQDLPLWKNQRVA